MRNNILTSPPLFCKLTDGYSGSMLTRIPLKSLARKDRRNPYLAPALPAID